jgi:hypothetical protein
MIIQEAVVPKGCEKNLGVLAYSQGYRDGQKRFYLTRQSLRDGGIDAPAPAIPSEFQGHDDAAQAYLCAEATGYELALNSYERLMRCGQPRPPAPTMLILAFVFCLVMAALSGCSSTCRGGSCSRASIGDKAGEKKLREGFRKGWAEPTAINPNMFPKSGTVYTRPMADEKPTCEGQGCCTSHYHPPFIIKLAGPESDKTP